MSTETYNGYTNYETWNVHLWITNDEPSYRAMLCTRGDSPWTPARARALVRRLYPHGTPDLADRGKSRAYARVNWQEVADAFEECA